MNMFHKRIIIILFALPCIVDILVVFYCVDVYLQAHNIHEFEEILHLPESSKVHFNNKNEIVSEREIKGKIKTENASTPLVIHSAIL